MDRRAVAVVAVGCVFALFACTGGAVGGVAPTAPPPAAGSVAAAPDVADVPPLPAGQEGGWEMAFSDEFDGSSLDASRWADHSSAEPDEGRGNLGNQQLEWNQAANCQVSGGALVMTAKRETVTSAQGNRYEWTSCLITTARSYTFQYGYLEERAILPGPRGFWPAFWTWPARGVEQHTETDVYEFYSDNHERLYVTQYSGAGGRCDWKPPFDPAQNWHVYGVAIEPAGTMWYVDGAEICHTGATSDAQAAVISNLAVYSKIPPDASTSAATKRVDYIRAWKATP
jgi:beta-glucanase (GH16 family)